MLSVLRSLLAAIAPGLVKNEAQERAYSDNRGFRDMLSAKRDPVPFGKKGLKPPPRPAEPEWPRAKSPRRTGPRR